MILLHKKPQKIPNPEIPQQKISQPENTMAQNDTTWVLALFSSFGFVCHFSLVMDVVVGLGCCFIVLCISVN